MSLKPKLLIMIDWFSPGYKAGGPIQSCVNLAYALKDEYEVFVFTSDTDHGEATPYENITSDVWIRNEILGLNIYYANKKTISFKQVATHIKWVDADFVYLNLLFSPFYNMFPLWLKYLGKIRGKLILCPRGSLYDSALSLRSYKKKPILMLYKLLGIGKQITFHATNKREENAILQYFPKAKVIIADNLPNARQEPLSVIAKSGGELKCIFVARIVAIKNVLFLLKSLFDVRSNVALTIVGPVEEVDYWEQCKQVIQQLPVNISVNYIGPKQNSELPEIIKQHHLFVLPTTGENFGHAIFEAFLSGRPVLISDQTPWLGLAGKNIGWDETLQIENFTARIEEMASLDQYQFDSKCNAAWQFANSFIQSDKNLRQYKLLFS